MLVGRSILAFSLALAMVVSLAPASLVRPVSEPGQGQAHGCCKKQSQQQSPVKKGACSGCQCALPCCRVIPIAPHTREQVVALAIVHLPSFSVPPLLHSLTDRDAIFHPPRV
jgi:hypothetical protein